MDHDIIDGREPHSESDILPEGSDDLDSQTGADDATDAEQIAEEAPRHIPGEVSEVLETGESAETEENTDIVENREPVEYDKAAEDDEAVENREAAEYDENADDAEIAETVETGGPVGGSSDDTHPVEDDAHSGESAETEENTDIVENREPVEYDEAAEDDEAVENREAAEDDEAVENREAAEDDENADDAEFAETVETGGPVGGSSDDTHPVEDDAHSVEPDEPRRTPVTPDNGYSRESYAIHATRSELPLFNDALNGGRSDLSWLSSLSSMLGGSKGPVGSAEGAAAVAHAAIDRRLATGKQADSAS